MIKVMQHYNNGGKVEHRLLSATVWHPIDYPYWDWSTYTYRIQTTETKQPLSAEDFPPGTAITRGQWNNRNHWRAVLMTSSEGVTLAARGVSFHLSYNALLDDFYSTDNGKTWRPCYKEV